jgi:hypothetical protein
VSACAFPAWFPLGALLGLLLSWLPFDDSGINAEYVEELFCEFDEVLGSKKMRKEDEYYEYSSQSTLVFFVTFIFMPVLLLYTTIGLISQSTS